MRTVKINGEEFNLQFRHVNNSNPGSYIKAAENGVQMAECYKSAYISGQIDLHAYEQRMIDDSGMTINELVDPRLISTTLNGATVCHIENDQREVLATGYSFCSEEDQFNKKLGRQIALGRAIAEFNRFSRIFVAKPL